FFAKITSDNRTNCGGQFTVMSVLFDAVLRVSSVTVTVAVTVFVWPCGPLSNVRVEASKVAFGLVSLLTLPSVTVHLYFKLPPQADEFAVAASVAVCWPLVFAAQVSVFGVAVTLVTSGAVSFTVIVVVAVTGAGGCGAGGGGGSGIGGHLLCPR